MFLQRFLHFLPACESGRQRRSKLVKFLAARDQLGKKFDPGVNRDPYGDVSRMNLRSVGGMNIAARQIQQVSLLELQFEKWPRNISRGRERLSSVRQCQRRLEHTPALATRDLQHKDFVGVVVG